MDEYLVLADAASEVYNELGSEMSESVYHRALESELSRRGVGFTSRGAVAIKYKGLPVGRVHPDLFVQTDDGQMVVEMKIADTGEDQLKKYLDVLASNDESITSGALVQFGDELAIAQYDPDNR